MRNRERRKKRLLRLQRKGRDVSVELLTVELAEQREAYAVKLSTLPKTVSSILLAIRLLDDKIAVLNCRIQKRITFFQSSTGRKLGEKPTTPCIEYVDGAERRRARKLVLGKRPAKMYVCHMCDNPKCAADGHLFWGTAQDNSHDMYVKGRHKSGKTTVELIAIALAKIQELQAKRDAIIMSLGSIS